MFFTLCIVFWNAVKHSKAKPKKSLGVWAFPMASFESKIKISQFTKRYLTIPKLHLCYFFILSFSLIRK